MSTARCLLIGSANILAMAVFNHAQALQSTHAGPMETVVVTSTREAKDSRDLAASVGVLGEGELSFVTPSHPAEALNRVAGVHINNLGGEGHMSAIRQPISTSGVYLFLEDGIPTRPSGFFNHNGLYEINIPQGSRLEVIKGPGSALYGSDAIGGVINSVTKAAPKEREIDINLESGSHGWQRLLFSGGSAVTASSAVRLDINATDSQGYRDESDYQRYSTTLRLDSQWSDHWGLKAIVSYTDVDQSGTSSLEEKGYKNNPTKNRFHDDIGFRLVEALRLSAELTYRPNEAQLLTITPFYRDNRMQMMPSWMVTFDPNLRDYQFESFGAQLKFRQNLAGGRGQVILGLDADYTPSSYEEQQIDVFQSGDIYSHYTATGTLNYDFDADQSTLSPYVHTEWKLGSQWLLSAGLRYDYYDVDYNDKGTANSARHLRPESQSLSFDELSPKLGLVYRFSDNHSAYVSYRHAFRAPTIGQLFRPGSSQDSTELRPVSSDSLELGLRGRLHPRWGYELAVYDMQVKDDIISFIDGFDRKTVNAGETQHRGIELSLHGNITEALTVNLAWTFTEQKYEDFPYIFQCFSPTCGGFTRETRNFSGFDVGKAPETLGNLSLGYQPTFLPGSRFELEVQHLGEYFTDETNTATYDGHNLVNLRANYDINPQISVYARLMNLTDRRYSSYTANQVGDPDISYRPGLPRSAYVGVKLAF